MLVDYLLNTPDGTELLRKVSLALVPIANTDGYAMQSRKSGSGYDLNRDQSKLADPVTLLLKKSVQGMESRNSAGYSRIQSVPQGV